MLFTVEENVILPLFLKQNKESFLNPMKRIEQCDKLVFGQPGSSYSYCLDWTTGILVELGVKASNGRNKIQQLVSEVITQLLVSWKIKGIG